VSYPPPILLPIFENAFPFWPCLEMKLTNNYSFHIFSSETNRFVRFWIGLPVPDRDWSFEWPSLQRDEL
jgi:hypothetical protein